MKKTSLRILSALLLCAMLPVGSIACAKDDGQQGDTPGTTAPVVDGTAETTPAETTDDGLDENGYLEDDLPDDLKFGTADAPETISFLTWSDVEHEEFFVENLNGETVNDALFTRNQKVEDRLNVKMTFYGIKGNASNVNNYVQYVGNLVNSGSTEFDIITAHSMTTAAVSSKGYLLNLLEQPYLNFEQPWWPERLLTEATINDKLFFASGDISANMLYMMYTCFYNKDMITNYGLENPQELVQSGEWTYDKFFEMCQGVYADLNGNQQKDQEDQFGYMTSSIHLDPWFYAAGNLFIEKDAEGKMISSPSFSSEEVIDIVDFMNHQFWETDDSLYVSSDVQLDAFGQKRLLFTIERARASIRNYAQTDVQYGIVPCPKYDTNQESYVTVVSNPFSLYALPITCRDPEMMAAVLECFASESYRLVTPALFEITLKVKYSDDAVSAEMYDLVRENVTFDLGRLFSSQLVSQTVFRNVIVNNQKWATAAKNNTKVMTSKLKTLQKAFE